MEFSSQVEHQAPVSRRRVQRQASNEVFLTSVGRPTETDAGLALVCGFQWPRRHPLYVHADGRVEVLLLAESLRQAAIAVTYAGTGPIGAVADEAFILATLGAEMTNEVWAKDGVSDVVADVSMTIRRKEGRQPTVQWECSFVLGDVHVGRAWATSTTFAPQRYELLRADRPRGEPGTPVRSTVLPVEVGRRDQADVVVEWREAGEEGPAQGALLCDVGHEVFFDVPYDHVPGMLTLEAAVQFWRLVNGAPAETVFVDGTFSGFLELLPETSIEASSVEGEGGHHVLTFGQDGAVLASVSVGQGKRP